MGLSCVHKVSASRCRDVTNKHLSIIMIIIDSHAVGVLCYSNNVMFRILDDSEAIFRHETVTVY